jgi:hypothetical protein
MQHGTRRALSQTMTSNIPALPSDLPVDLSAPDNLTAEAIEAHALIVAFLTSRGLDYTGGCRAFYSPAEWAQRGERYGARSVLVVVHDGGSVGRAFSYDREDYETIDAMTEALRPLGLYAEQCTTWYSAIYRIG